MNKITFFTPSYRGDVQRFLLLRQSINHFYKGKSKHIVVVPSSDESLFKELCLTDPDVEVLLQNDFVDSIFYPTPLYIFIKRFFPNQTWRFQKYAGRPGWIIQQIVKLNIPLIVNEGPIVCLDSDIFFVRPFSDTDFKLNQSDYTLYKATPKSETAKQQGHMEWARNFLGLEKGSTDHHYITWPTVLYPDVIKELHQFIEKKYNIDWQQCLFNQPSISEYILYGVFMEEIYKSKKTSTTTPPHNYIVWDNNSYISLFENLPKYVNSNLLVTLQSNLHIPSNVYEKRIRSEIFN